MQILLGEGGTQFFSYGIDADMPPSMKSSIPVMWRASLDSRNKTAWHAAVFL